MSDHIAQNNQPDIILSREKLYNEIWEISLSGVAKKYGVSYARLRKECADADIPVPPPGYWSQLEYGKDVPKPPLPEAPKTFVDFSAQVSAYKSNKKALSPLSIAGLPKILTAKFSQVKQTAGKAPKDDPVTVTNLTKPEVNLAPPETFHRWGQTFNVYDREVLYGEVWRLPVTEVAKKYSVSDVTIHKICKSMNIPTPPPGYWAKLRAGKSVAIPPLPPTTASDRKIGPRTDKPGVLNAEWSGCLGFLGEEERAVVLQAAEHIVLTREDSPLHPRIAHHQDAAAAWENHRRGREDSGWEQWSGRLAPPFLWEELTEETLPRVGRIIDSLIRALEPLGAALTDDLNFLVNGEEVSLTVKENKKKVIHNLTKQERKELSEYQEAIRKGQAATKPNIRKYDYVYKGRLTLHIEHWREFRDSSKVRLEARLGEILIGLYEASEIVRKERLEREEALEQLEKETRRREEGRERYNAEMEKITALTNQAMDYDLACKIRNYVAAVASKENPDHDWIHWALAKADWYDPTVARSDEQFGKRSYDQGAGDKTPGLLDPHGRR